MTLSPQELHGYLSALVRRDLTVSTMIWGPPGVGKSSIVSQVARELGLEFTDVRLSQLAPTDLRGLPVAENGVSRWFPPEFLPRSGRGVLFLDELNMAPPTMQGMAQQLILDRRVGSYALPDGWFVWAAGNRKEDRASVFDMPAPLANRFVHLEVRPDFAAWRAYAHAARIHPHVIAFLMYRSELLHALDPARPAWPSPRSWSVASDLHAADLDVAPAIGRGRRQNSWLSRTCTVPSPTWSASSRVRRQMRCSQPNPALPTPRSLPSRTAPATPTVPHGRLGGSPPPAQSGRNSSSRTSLAAFRQPASSPPLRS